MAIFNLRTNKFLKSLQHDEIMKIKLSFLLAFICTVQFAISQNDCNMYYPLNEGAKFQITTYDKSNKPTSVLDYVVLDVKNTASGTVATIKGSVKDKKDKMLSELEYEVTCKDNKLSIDYESLLSPQMLQQFGEMDYEISGTNLDWPNDLSVGKILPDANMNMKIGMAGMNMNMEMNISDRKVTGKENVTTPAGTYECYVITYNTSVKMMGTAHNSSSKQWVSKGVGLVKQEDIQKGKVENTSMLTAFSN